MVSPTAVALCHAFLFRSGFAHADNVITKRCSKTITWLFLSRLQGNKPLLNLPKPWNSPPAQTGTLRNLRNLPPEPTPAHIGILWNLPEPASGTYTTTHRDFPEPSGTCLRNLHQHTPEPSGTFRNLPPEPTPAHAGTLRKLHQHSGTFRNLPPEPIPAHTGTLRNLPPEPSSGTCSCDPHRHTPELIWAEDPISLRCWGIINKLWWYPQQLYYVIYSIWILMSCLAIWTVFLRSGFAHVDNVITSQRSK